MPEMVTIKYDDLSAAFDFVSFCGSVRAPGTRFSGHGHDSLDF
jgi:hypothetical protein